MKSDDDDQELLIKILEDLAHNAGCSIQWSVLTSNNCMIGHLKKTMARQSDGYIKDIVIGNLVFRSKDEYFTLKDLQTEHQSWPFRMKPKTPDWAKISFHDPEMQNKFNQIVTYCVSTVNERFTGGKRKSRKKQVWQ